MKIKRFLPLTDFLRLGLSLMLDGDSFLNLSCLFIPFPPPPPSGKPIFHLAVITMFCS